MGSNAWDFQSIKYGEDAHRAAQDLYLAWSLDYDDVSADYSQDTPAAEVFKAWLGQIPEGVEDINIDWIVYPIGEGLPFVGDDEDFLTHYRWPTHAESGERMSWFRLPVEDKAWNAERTDPGGFIQEVTGFKPATFQRTVHLPTLLRGSGWTQ